jgi:hypothetical protein
MPNGWPVVYACHISSLVYFYQQEKELVEPGTAVDLTSCLGWYRLKPTPGWQSSGWQKLRW